MKDSFIFYDSFLSALDELEPDSQLKIYQAITHFALKNEEPENLIGIEKAIFALIKPQILANELKREQYLKDVENGKKGAKYGKLGGRPTKNNPPEKPPKNPPGVSEKNPINVNANVNENVNANVNENVNANVNENVITTSTTPAENLIKNWYGEYSNVHLTDEQFNKLKVSYIGSEKVLSELIEELSSNIVRGKAPPYDDTNENIHFAELRAYWKYRKLNGSKPQTQAEKANEFKKKMEELTAKYRIQEANSG